MRNFLLLAAAMMIVGSAATAAHAADDDTDFVCYDTDEGDGLVCESIDTFKLGCKIADNEPDECKAVLGELDGGPRFQLTIPPTRQFVPLRPAVAQDPVIVRPSAPQQVR